MQIFKCLIIEIIDRFTSIYYHLPRLNVAHYESIRRCINTGYRLMESSVLPDALKLGQSVLGN